MFGWIRWFRSRLYHKLVLSHALFLFVFLSVAILIGRSAFREFAHLMFRMQFDRQTRLLFHNLERELTRESAIKPQRKHTKATSTLTATTRPATTRPAKTRPATTRPATTWPARSTKGVVSARMKAPQHALTFDSLPASWRSTLAQHTTLASQFLVTFAAVLTLDGRCLLETYPPVLLDVLMARKWHKKYEWKRLLLSPKVVMKRGQNGRCQGVDSLKDIRHGSIRQISNHTLHIEGYPPLVIRYLSLSPFRDHPPPGAFLFSLVLVFGMAMVLVFPINRSITRPLRELTESVKQIQSGELTKEVPAHGIDEVGQLAVATEDMRRTLLAYQEQRRVLLSDVSHEIRTPLSRIRAVAESVADGLMREPAPLTQAMEGVCQQVDEIDQLLGDLLDIARLELSRAKQLSRSSFDAGGLLREMYRALVPAAKAHDVSLLLRLPDEESLVLYADKRRLRQVVNNLVQNAIRHSPPKGEIILQLSLHRLLEEGQESRRLCLEVLDQGPGIPVADRERVFERLVRLDPSRNRHTGGQGLGLAIVWQIVDAHEGRVGVSDAPSGGARFWVHLPVEEAPEAGNA